jgi:hypothetical protein
MAAAPEGGALADQLALIPTSSWWALVIVKPYLAMHGLERDGVKSNACAIRGSLAVGKPLCRGLS